MNRTEIISIIKDNQERISQEQVAKRSLVIPPLPEKKACTIIGPRRSGKTFYLYQIGQECIATHGIENVLYINFEDDRLYPLSLSDCSEITKLYYELYPDQKEKKSLFLFDELQVVDGWERFTRRLIDTEKCDLYITGSSSKLLSKEIATSLRGRTLVFEIFPYDEQEFLTCKNFNPARHPNYSSKQLAQLKNFITEYLGFGGFPELINCENKTKEKILKNYIDIMLYHDIIERNSIRNISAVKIFLKMLVLSVAKEFSVNKVYNFFQSNQIKVSKSSLYEYVQYFNDALIIFPLRKFGKSIKQQEQSIPKIYLSDIGYTIPYMLGELELSGRLLENAVFMKFRRTGFEENKNLFYYVTRKGYEIDFVLFKQGKPETLVQCCFSLAHDLTKQREIRALKDAKDELKCSNLIVITWDFEDVKDGIRYIPYWKWCLT